MPKPTRRRFDDDDHQPEHPDRAARSSERLRPDDDDFDDDAPRFSSYFDDFVVHGPEPTPPWVVTSPAALDDDLGVLKSGKEADVSLLRRTLDDHTCLLAVKRYRDAHHRLFHRDAGYLEGRRTRYSRENRAMDTRTEFGRQIIAGQWAVAEFAVLGRLWSAGAAVPYPVQLLGTELMMEFVGSPDGVAAPRLAQTRPGRREANELYRQLRGVLVLLADQGLAHGDLSPYNVLVHDGRLVLIDLPQAVDLVGNPQGFEFLRRDCENICTWFAARGVDADPAELHTSLLRSVPRS